MHTGMSPVFGNNQVDPIEQISNFVDWLRVHGRGCSSRRDSHSSTREKSRSQDRERSTRPREDRQVLDEARDIADRMILDAEKFKASVSAPQGRGEIQVNREAINAHPEVDFNNFIQSLINNQDDEFFHMTCHVEESLKKRIEKEKFVDLKRLLPKSCSKVISDEQHLQQFIKRDGSVFWASADKNRDNRITNVRKWEQAFRVYAAVYCKANPNRSAEIWQYVATINAAAGSFVWENVAYYDFSFPQLMAEKPKRSWAKTYTQLWTMAMCEPLPRTSTNSIAAASQQSSWKDRCCWRFNKGKRKKWNCKFDHRCSVCGAYSHIKLHCPKRKGQDTRMHCDRSKSRSRSPQGSSRKSKKGDKH